MPRVYNKKKKKNKKDQEKSVLGNVEQIEKARPEVNTDLLAKRYFQGDEKSWEDVVKRVARHAGKKSGRIKEFYEAIYSGKFFPSRMAYMGTENPFASSCFVFPVEDSLHSIMKTLSDACKVQKFGGGTGYNFSRLRPKGDLINTSKGEASGPVSFMGLYHDAMEVVHRAGKKHAAQMGILNCDHPDIMKFIQCKDKEGAYWTFNISVGVTDDFMKAVKNNEDWDLKFGGKVYETIKAKELWDYIVQHAWHNGDPGVIFLDTVNRNNKYPEPIEACNPCGEQMLPPYVSCNLGSLDLSRFVKKGKVDWKSLEEATRTGTRFLDGSVDSAYWPVDKIRERTRKFKNIGLGVMGWADMLILLGIPYDSEEALELGEKVMKFINDTAEDESIKLGNGKRKNTTLTSIAPTGSISILAGCSSGIEPLFGVSTMKNTYVGSYANVHWIFEEIAKERGFYSEELMKKIAEEGSIQHMDEIPDEVKRLFRTSMEIDWDWHVRHQAVFQKHTDNAVSKTINLANNATVEDVNKAYVLAYETGCKSITVYRDGSRQVQVLDAKTKNREMCPNCEAILFMKDGVKMCVTCGYKPSEDSSSDASGVENGANNEEEKIVGKKEERKVERPAKENGQPLIDRPFMARGATYRLSTPVGTAFITINENMDGEPLELFINIGKAGSDLSSMAHGLGRTISAALRFNSSLSPRERAREIAEQLAGNAGRRSVGFGPNKILSLPDAVSAALSMHFDFNINGFGQLGLDADGNLKTKKLEGKDGNGKSQLNGGQSSGEKKINGEVDLAREALLKSVETDTATSNVDNNSQKVAFKQATKGFADLCPSCGGSSLVYQEGCAKCHSCGYSEC